MTAGLGTYMTLKMWSEVNEALGTVFGASWGVIIATIAYLVYSVKERQSGAGVHHETEMGVDEQLGQRDHPSGSSSACTFSSSSCLK